MIPLVPLICYTIAGMGAGYSLACAVFSWRRNRSATRRRICGHPVAYGINEDEVVVCRLPVHNDRHHLVRAADLVEIGYARRSF